MLFKFTVKAKKGSSVQAVERLERLLADKKRLNNAIGKGFEKTLKTHFRNLDKRKNKRGWRKQHLWQRIANHVVYLGANETGATVSIQNTEGRIFAGKVFGAHIRPKAGKKFLAIPAIEARYGQSPSALDGELEFRRTRKGGILGRIKADGSMDIHYWLVRKSDVPRDENALPKFEQVAKDAKKAISLYLKLK